MAYNLQDNSDDSDNLYHKNKEGSENRNAYR